MDIYKEAARNKIRISTFKGLLSVESIWDLKLTELDKLAVGLQEEVERSTTKSFLKPKSTEDVETKLKFDIVLDILETKQKERDEANEAAKKKDQRDKIASIIANKEDEVLHSKSLDELKKMLEE